MNFLLHNNRKSKTQNKIFYLNVVIGCLYTDSFGLIPSVSVTKLLFTFNKSSENVINSAFRWITAYDYFH